MFMATIDIPENLVEEIEELLQAGVIESHAAFAQEAIREKLLSARMSRFVRDVHPLEQDLAEVGISEEALLKEFDRFRHAAHNHR